MRAFANNLWCVFPQRALSPEPVSEPPSEPPSEPSEASTSSAASAPITALEVLEPSKRRRGYGGKLLGLVKHAVNSLIKDE